MPLLTELDPFECGPFYKDAAPGGAGFRPPPDVVAYKTTLRTDLRAGSRRALDAGATLFQPPRMKPFPSLIAYGLVLAYGLVVAQGAETKTGPDWRPLPLIVDGKVAEGWRHVGWGGFAVDDGALRTECDGRGLGLLVYAKERFGNCQLRVVFKSKDAKSNAGMFVRIADGILEQVNQPGAVFDRGANGKISKASMTNMMVSAERHEGPWFAVHRGYEVQIKDADDKFHRTGAIYSLAPSSAISQKPPGEWKTMIITLSGNRIFVDLEGRRITSFDPESPEVPRERKWFEPKREPPRPESGYLGLQNHDPGDIVWFREISVRPLPDRRAN